jgi:hypothetical protein
MSALRLRELALRRELLVVRAELQRQSLRAQWRAGTEPLEQLQSTVDRYRSWLGPVSAVAGVPLLWLLKPQRKTWWRLARWALAAWPAIRVARKLMRR